MHAPHSRAHTVVRAAAWSDGGAEFIYGDGTILSFMDSMNTFVAVCGNVYDTSTHTEVRRSHRGSSSSNNNISNEYCKAAQACNEAEREMCFTAWTLSNYESKVRAALAIYNSLAERPRLISTLLPDVQPLSSSTGSAAHITHASATTHYRDRESTLLRDSPSPCSNSCSVWRVPGPPIHTLLLEKRPDLFTRYAVYGEVREWLLEPTASPSENIQESTTFSSYQDGSDGSKQEQNHLVASNDGQRSATSSSQLAEHKLPHQVPVGTVLELWCALRRTRLTVAVHRATFTVRWPAPVTRPDGSRLPPSLTSSSFSVPSLQSCNSTTAISAEGYGTPVLFTYIEQTFPVCNPPPAWQAMLQMALELDAELPMTNPVYHVETKGHLNAGQKEHLDYEEGCKEVQLVQEFTDACQWNARLYSSVPPVEPSNACLEENATECQHGWLGELPDPHHWGGVLNHNRTTHPCRFSELTVSQATHFAAPRTARALEAMRSLHQTNSPNRHEGRLCWLYEANPCAASGYTVGIAGGGEAGGGPPAVYWCLPAPLLNSGVGTQEQWDDDVQRRQLEGADVLAWVAEDGSVVHLCLEGQGYTVQHQRVEASVSKPAVYRLSAEGAAVSAQHRLPPKVAPLRCRVRLFPARNNSKVLKIHLNGSSMKKDLDCSGQRSPRAGADSIARYTASAGTAVAVVDPLTLQCARATKESAVPLSASMMSACFTLTALTALTPATTAVNSFALTAFRTALASAALTTTARKTDRLYDTTMEGEAQRLRCGRYLASVADVCVQVSQLNCAVARARLQAIARPTVPCATIAAYCKPSLLSGNTSNIASSKTCFSGTNTNPSNVPTDSIVHLTSRLDGIGNFTALTNGTLRGHFDDRAIVTLIPGANELDEMQLLATCVLPDAKRCTIHVSQCRPGHPIFRYLAYMLPFRRFVYLQAVQQQDKMGQLQPHVSNRSCTSHTLYDSVVSPVEVSFAEESNSCLPSSIKTSHDEATVVCEVENDCGTEQRRYQTYNPTFSTGSAGVVSRPQPACWGIADGACTLQSLRDKEAAEVADREERLRQLLAENESLSLATRALLRD